MCKCMHNLGKNFRMLALNVQILEYAECNMQTMDRKCEDSTLEYHV